MNKYTITRIFGALLCAASLTAVSFGATISSDLLLGQIVPGTPANEVNETEMVRFLAEALNGGLATMSYPNAGIDLGDNPADPQTETYTLWKPAGITLPAPLPTATGTGTTTSNTTINLNVSWDYLVAKFGSDSEAFWIGSLAPGSYTIPNLTGNENALSGYTLINSHGMSVPDGCTSALLVGLGLIAIGFARHNASRIRS